MGNLTTAHCVLAAKRPTDGAEVFLDFEGAWNENVREAAVSHSADEERALLDRGAHDASHNVVVGPHLVQVREVDDTVVFLRD